MTEFVMVRISGEETVRYSQTVQMPREEFESLSKMLDSKDRKESRKAESLIGDLWIDRNDPMDSSDFELDDFELAARADPVTEVNR